jgi:hypothetical protein
MLNPYPDQMCNQVQEILEVCDLNVLHFSIWCLRKGSKRITPQIILLRALDYICAKALVPNLKGNFACGYYGDKFVVICKLSKDDIQAILESVPITGQNYAWDYLWETFVRNNKGVSHVN